MRVETTSKIGSFMGVTIVLALATSVGTAVAFMVRYAFIAWFQ